MKNLQEEKLAILRRVDGKEVTKKELVEMGINNYFIKVFMESNIISRISRGNYKVSFTKKDTNENSHKMFQYFYRFKYKVLNGKHIEAYDALMENYRLQSSHDYDNHMRIYFILLKELLGNAYDFSPLDELYEFMEEKTGTYCDYFVDFRRAVMAGNFYDANGYLEKFTAEEKRLNGFNNISTILFNNLLEDVLKKIEASYNTQANYELFNEYNYKLVGAIINKDYKEALKYVEKCIFSSKNEKTTLIMKKIRIILNDIIAIKEENLRINPDYVDYSKTNNIYSKFYWALGAKDYYQAENFLAEIMENDNRGIFKTVKRVISDVIEAMREKTNNSNYTENEDKLIDPETLAKVNSPLTSQMAYRIFLNEYEEGNYENALYHLEISMLKNNEPIYERNNKKLCALLKELIDMEKNKHGFIEVNVDYSDASDVSILFNKALENGDFKTAFRNSGKMTYQNNSKVLNLFKDLLHRMYELDKKYGSVKKNEAKQEVISNDELINLVNERRYAELFALLDKKRKVVALNRLEHVVFKLLRIYNVVIKGKYEVPNHTYTSDERDYLGMFFEAIRCEDIYTAYNELSNICGNVDNQQEFDIFEIILNDIIDKKEEINEEENAKKIEAVIIEEIRSILKNKMELSDDDIEQLYNCVADLQNVSQRDIVYMIADIVEFIELANSNKIDANYLDDLSEDEEFSSSKNDIMFYLQNGYYINALKNINNLDHKKFSYQERGILKSLLTILNKALVQERNYNVVCEEIPKNHFENLKALIKKYDFYAAFYYIIENDLHDEYLNDIFPIIFEEMAKLLIIQEDYYKEFVQAIEEKRMDDARIAMINFKECLDKTSLKRGEHSQDKYLEMKKKLQK